MDSNNKPNLEEVNYRTVPEGEINCIHCNHSDDSLNFSDDGIVITKCHFFGIKIDELHVCDLID